MRSTTNKKRAVGVGSQTAQVAGDLATVRGASTRDRGCSKRRIGRYGQATGVSMKSAASADPATWVGTSKLVVNRCHAGLRDPPAHAGLHIGGWRNDQANGFSPPIRVVIVGVPRLGASESLTPTFGCFAPTGERILLRNQQRHGCNNKAENDLLHWLASLTKLETRTTSEQSGSGCTRHSNHFARAGGTRRCRSGSGRDRRCSSDSTCGGVGTAVRAA